jgi:hypothetical protein
MSIGSMRLEVTPDRLTAASVRVLGHGRALSLATRAVARALDEVGTATPGSQAAAAAAELALAAAGALRAVTGGVDALAVALAAAASRYAEADVLPGQP